MKASEHVYRQVAEHCSSYTAEDGAHTTSTTNHTSNSASGSSYNKSVNAAYDASCHASNFAADSASNSTCGCEPISCTNCAHFDSHEHCVLDLYDKIVAKHNF